MLLTSDVTMVIFVAINLVHLAMPTFVYRFNFEPWRKQPDVGSQVELKFSGAQFSDETITYIVAEQMYAKVMYK